MRALHAFQNRESFKEGRCLKSGIYLWRRSAGHMGWAGRWHGARIRWKRQKEWCEETLVWGGQEEMAVERFWLNVQGLIAV